MPDRYDPTELDRKWQRRWEEARVPSLDTSPGKTSYMLTCFRTRRSLSTSAMAQLHPGDALYRRERMSGRRTLNP